MKVKVRYVNHVQKVGVRKHKTLPELLDAIIRANNALEAYLNE